MKKLVIAGLLAAALSLTTLSQQKAAAWGCGDCGDCNSCGGCCPYGGCWGFGFNFSFTRCGCSNPCWNACSFCAPCASPCANICDSGYTPIDYGCPTAAYPVAPSSPDVQAAGYNYNYAAPSYWYGR